MTEPTQPDREMNAAFHAAFALAVAGWALVILAVSVVINLHPKAGAATFAAGVFLHALSVLFAPFARFVPTNPPEEPPHA